MYIEVKKDIVGKELELATCMVIQNRKLSRRLS